MHEQRVAVGLRAGRMLSRDVARRTRPVLDDDRRAGELADLVSKVTDEDVRSAPGREGADEPDVLARVLVGRTGTACQTLQGCEGERQGAETDGLPPRILHRFPPMACCETIRAAARRSRHRVA